MIRGDIHPARRRWAGSCALLLAAGTLAVWTLNPRSPENPAPDPVRAANPSPLLAEIAGQLADRARLEWSAQGREIPGLDDLVHTARLTLLAQFAGDFDAHEQLMAERGMSLGSAAAAMRDTGLRSGYGGADPAAWSAAPVRTCLASMWSKPASRMAEFLLPDPDRATFGTSAALSADDSRQGVTFQFTVFDGVDLAALLKGADEGRTPTAWLRFPCLFADGAEFDVRLMFILDEPSARWIPVNIMTIGKGRTHPWLLL